MVTICRYNPERLCPTIPRYNCEECSIPNKNDYIKLVDLGNEPMRDDTAQAKGIKQELAERQLVSQKFHSGV